MDKQLEEKIINTLKKLQKQVSLLEEENKSKEKTIKKLEKAINYYTTKQDLVRLQKRINTFEAELQDIKNYLQRKG